MLYKYEATVLRTIDGDTVVMEIDLGLKVRIKTSCRLYGINAPELRSPDPWVRDNARKATEYLANRLSINKIYLIDSKELDKYGRPLVIIYDDGKSINQEMIDKGLAVEYYG